MNKLSPRLSLISLCLMSAHSFSTHAEESKQTTVLDEITVTVKNSSVVNPLLVQAPPW